MFNEENYILSTISELITLKNQDSLNTFEIIVVDDASTDASYKKLESLIGDNEIIYVRNHANLGKGRSVQVGIVIATGTHILIQDADNEYSPKDIPSMLLAISQMNDDVIYGSRYLHKQGTIIYKKFPGQSIGSWIFAILLPIYVFLIKRVWINDLLTGYKIYPARIFKTWTPTTTGFETDHEITCHILNRGFRIIEIPITYIPRSKKQGKKIGHLDAIKAISAFWKFRND